MNYKTTIKRSSFGSHKNTIKPIQSTTKPKVDTRDQMSFECGVNSRYLVYLDKILNDSIIAEWAEQQQQKKKTA